MLYSVDQTKVIPEKELESLKNEMSENEFRQEFLCDFNAAADNALIPIDLVREAATRQYREHQYASAPRIMGVDVARFGSDASVIFKRQGLVAFEPIIIRKFDNVAVAQQVAMQIVDFKPDAVFIDIGEGAGVDQDANDLRRKAPTRDSPQDHFTLGAASRERHGCLYKGRRAAPWCRSQSRARLLGESSDLPAPCSRDRASRERFCCGLDQLGDVAGRGGTCGAEG